MTSREIGVSRIVAVAKPRMAWRGPSARLSSSHGDHSQGRLAMRLTLRVDRWAQVALMATWVLSSGCQKLPYIDQSKPVPHETMGKIPLEDKEEIGRAHV